MIVTATSEVAPVWSVTTPEGSLPFGLTKVKTTKAKKQPLR